MPSSTVITNASTTAQLATMADTPVAGIVTVSAGDGSPEGVVTAVKGSIYQRTDGGLGTTFYVKETGTGTSGWLPKGISQTNYDFPMATGATSINRQAVNASGNAISSGQLLLSYFTATNTETINTLAVVVAGTAAAATPTLIRFGVYSVAANGDLTLLNSTVSDTTLLATTFTRYQKALSSGFSKVAGTRYALGVLIVTGAALPTFFASTSSGQASGVADTFLGLEPRMSATLNSQTDLPSSAASGTLSNTRRGPIYWEMIN